MVTSEQTAPPLATSGVREITARTAPHLRRWLNPRALLIAALLGVIAWAAVALRELGDETTAPPVYAWAAVVLRAVGDKTTAPSVEVIVDEEAPPPETRPLAGRVAKGFLELQIVVAAETGGEAFAALGDAAVEPGRITVVNLWGTFCEPCKKEFLGLREVLRGAQTRQPHGNKVRFVPMLVDRSATLAEAQTIYDELGGPSAHAFIADAAVDDGVRGELDELGVLDGDFGLPTTLVLDCNRRLRWHHQGALRREDFTALAQTLLVLQEEFADDRCDAPTPARAKRKRRPPAAAPRFLDIPDDAPMTGEAREPKQRQRSLCDSDGVCDGQHGETAINCPGDCKPEL